MPKASPSLPSKKGKGRGKKETPPPSESESALDDTDNDDMYTPKKKSQESTSSDTDSQLEPDDRRGRPREKKRKLTQKEINIKGTNKRATKWSAGELNAMMREASRHQLILRQRKTKRNATAREEALTAVTSKYILKELSFIILKKVIKKINN